MAAVISHAGHAALGPTWPAAVLATGAGGLAMLAVYVLLLRVLDTPELYELLTPLLRRGLRSGGAHVL